VQKGDIVASKKFEEALKIVRVVEGGYVNDPHDPGGATKYGITQRTYNAYRKKSNLNLKEVKYLQEDEAEEIYYKEYWVESGAENFNDPRMSLAVFDGEVNHGHSANKKFIELSKGRFNDYLNIRIDSYKKDPNAKRYVKGWLNRIDFIKNNAEEYKRNVERDDVQDSNNKQSFKSENLNTNKPAKLISGMLQNQLASQNDAKMNFLQRIYMDTEGIQKRFNGVVPEDYKNPHLDNDKIFTKEEIDKMTWAETKKNQQAINYQKKVMGVPTKQQAEKAATKKGSGLVHVSGYTTTDGRKVADYYRALPKK